MQVWSVVSLCSHFGGSQGCRVKILTVRKQMVKHASELSRQHWVSSSAFHFSPNFGGCLSTENGDMDPCGCGRHDSRLHASVWQQPFTASVAYANSGKRRKSLRGQCREQVRKRPSTDKTGRSHKHVGI